MTRPRITSVQIVCGDATRPTRCSLSAMSELDVIWRREDGERVEVHGLSLGRHGEPWVLARALEAGRTDCADHDALVTAARWEQAWAC